MNRLVIFIDAHQRHVDIEARKIKVVGVAAEEGRLKFRRKHQTDVGIFLITIKIVLAALIKRYDV